MITIVTPADAPGPKAIRNSNECIFLGCQFLIEDMDVYRIHLANEHGKITGRSVIFTETSKTHAHSVSKEKSTSEEESASEAANADDLEAVLQSSRLNSTPSRLSVTSSTSSESNINDLLTNSTLLSKE
ncbi:hypothetical protein INT43_007789 [Umbelopsis isabellina]|uniref:Uncharacterized protein n=1 Tax=Mortierella isabellina TaxID=91625 RepID=A0A8H7PNM7_MORIS|nr:hypothetical protein INT43_007789 [Umbelopsis isabellina]